MSEAERKAYIRGRVKSFAQGNQGILSAYVEKVEAEAAALYPNDPAPLPGNGGLREEVRWFAGEMERQLRENDGKRGWQDCGRTWLAGQARTNLSEVLRLDFSEKDAIVKAAADAANFCMMIADNRTSPRAVLGRPAPAAPDGLREKVIAFTKWRQTWKGKIENDDDWFIRGIEYASGQILKTLGSPRKEGE